MSNNNKVLLFSIFSPAFSPAFSPTLSCFHAHLQRKFCLFLNIYLNLFPNLFLQFFSFFSPNFIQYQSIIYCNSNLFPPFFYSLAVLEYVIFHWKFRFFSGFFSVLFSIFSSDVVEVFLFLFFQGFGNVVKEGKPIGVVYGRKSKSLLLEAGVYY
jgi:hypothetical protein